MDATPTEPDTQAPSAAPSGHGRLVLVLSVAAGIVLVDLLTKLAVVAWLEGEEPIRIIGGFVELDVTRNSGAAFSIGTGYTFIFPIIAIVVAVVVVRQARKLTSLWWAVTLGALLGGALGNVVCRVFREPGFLRGHVVDFVAVGNFPVFNVADSAITLSAIGIVVLTVLGIGFDGKRAHEEEPTTDTGYDDHAESSDTDG